MKVAAVIGATGYVGSAVVNCLLGRGYNTVRCAMRTPEGAGWLQELCVDGKDRVALMKIDMSSDTVGSDLDGLLEGAQSVFFCAGFETQSPETIEFMRGSALNVIKAAERQKVGVVVLTSSGGSTNPPGHKNETPKNEVIHWSDPEVQQQSGRFSPAAKTLMEMASLAAVGRNQQNEVVDDELGKKAPRLCIMNPNLILGPPLRPGGVSGNSLPWVARILRGEAMNEKVPNDSMSIIDVRDLAELHVQCAEQESASGRYFGVSRSWPWSEILDTFKAVYPAYKLPPMYEGEANVETQFDFSRRDSLGVALRPLETTVKDLVSFLQKKAEVP